MLNSARLNNEFRRGLWTECARTACPLHKLDCNRNLKSRYVASYGKDYKGFGEIGVVTKGDKVKSKLVNRGEAYLYLGHADNHSGEAARFLILSTKRVIRSRDVKLSTNTKNQKACKEIMKIRTRNPIMIPTQKMRTKILIILLLKLKKLLRLAHCAQLDLESNLLLLMKVFWKRKKEIRKLIEMQRLSGISILKQIEPSRNLEHSRNLQILLLCNKMFWKPL